MADRTHSHDTSTPAMSAETVPSEEFVLVPRDRGQTFSNSTLPTEMIAAGMEVLERADDDLACRNGEDVPDWDYGMEAVAVYRAMIAAAPAPNPSPAAKGGEAVREIAAGLERSAGKPLVEGSWGGLALEPVARAIAQDRGALSTPTEGPASQTEGMGGDAEARRKRASELMAPLMELSEDELILLRHSLPVETLARLRATLTPPETAEAVPGDLTAVLVQGVQMLSAHIERFHDHEEETEEKVDIRGIKDHLEGAALVSVLGSIQTPSSQPTNAATASDPVPATDDRERLVEALRPFANAVFNDNGDMTVSPVTDYDAYVNAYFVRRAALATEASR